MRTVIVNVATGRYVKGQARLMSLLPGKQQFMGWSDRLPTFSPTHADKPYAFKAWALKCAADTHGFDMALWCDACIVLGARPLQELWDYIEREGVWLSRNGWTNYQWTADSAYKDLFAQEYSTGVCDKMVKEYNRNISHVVATAFGLNFRHEKGRKFLDEYVRLAQTDSFKGPWTNTATLPDYHGPINDRTGVCGPIDVLGHRHDQTAASVIAWRLGVPLTDPPEWFSYAGGENASTALIADGNY